jgi:hypothetical protein
MQIAAMDIDVGGAIARPLAGSGQLEQDPPVSAAAHERIRCKAMSDSVRSIRDGASPASRWS